MICPNCKTENRDKAKFCDECGFPLTPSVDETSILQPIENESAAQSVELENPETDDSTFEDESIDSSANEGAEVEPFSDEHSEYENAEHHLDELPSIGADLSGFVFASSDPSELEGESYHAAYDEQRPRYSSPQNFDASETAVISRDAIMQGDHTEVLPRIEQEQVADHMKVSAPANKKEERERKKEMKKHEREARKRLHSNNTQSKVRSSVVIVILVVLVLGVLTAGVSYYLELWGGKTVPSTQGMTEADAVYTLQNYGFKVTVDNVKSDDTAGLVLLTDPSEGSRLPEGSEVVVHVSTSRTIPDIVGKTLDQAKSALEDGGYTNISDTVYQKTNAAAEGTVLEVEPKAGTVAKSNTKVTLKVATPFRVPDVTGMTEANATYTLREAGYYVYVSEIETTAISEGLVYSTNPSADTQLDEDSYVTIYVAVQRATKLEEAAKSYLNSVGSVTIGGTTYTINSVTGVAYASNGVVNFTIMGSPTTTFLGESITLSSRSVSGSIQYDDNNQLVSIS